MERENEANTPQANESQGHQIYGKVRTWVITSIGVILAFLLAAVIFILSSLEGTKEVKANRSTGSKILQLWRDENGVTSGFPEEGVDLIAYGGHEYYFVIDEYNEETSSVVSWHFSYDGGFDYIFKNVKFYVMTVITAIFCLVVSSVNYKSTSNKQMNTLDFQVSMSYYQKQKTAAAPYFQFLPQFCSYKNTQLYEAEKYSIVEDAGITKAQFDSKEFDLKKLEPWQRKTMKGIKRIRILRLKTSDLLQEKGKNTRKISLLPMGAQEHERRFMVSGAIKNTFSILASGLVIGFGVVFGEWQLGLTYGSFIFSSYVTSVIVASDFVLTTLRNRYIAKADYLQEFCNIVGRFSNEK